MTSVIEDKTNPNRVAQGKTILDTLEPLHLDIPVIILCDFNTFPDWPETLIFSSQYQDTRNVAHSKQNGYNWPTYGSPNQRIDYIFVDDSISILNCSISNNLSISDHNAI